MAYPNGYTHHATLTVDRTQCGSGGAIPNFVVPWLGDPAFRTTGNGGHSRSNGADVLFTSDAAGLTPLPYEQVTGAYNAVTGATEIHINAGTGASQVSSTADATIHVWIGKTGATDGSSRDASMWVDALFVYHFGGNSLDLTDSSGHGRTLIDAHANLGHAAGVPGVGAFGAVVLTAAPAGGPGGYAKVANPGLAIPFTVSCWAKNMDAAAGDPATATSNAVLWAANVNLGSDYRAGFMALANGSPFFAFANDVANIDGLAPAGTPSGPDWNYYAATAVSTSLRRYQLNGNGPATSTVTVPNPGALGLLAFGIWLMPSENLFWDASGLLDEVRGWAVARSDAWNLAEFNALSHPATFAVLSPFVAPQYVLSAGTASGTLTGTAATLRLGRRLAAGSGAYTCSGTAATLTRTGGGSHTLMAGSAAYAATGTAAALRASRELVAGAGVFTCTGRPASLRVQGGAALPADLVTTVWQIQTTVSMTAAVRTTVVMTAER